MSWVKGVGALLLVIGVLALLAGFILGVSPETVEKAVTAPHESVIVDETKSISPLTYAYVDFSVPTSAKSAFLDIEVKVLSGNDVKVVLYRGSSKIYERTVQGYLSDTIPLGGPGSFELRLDNSFSLITSKTVHVKAVLRWSEVHVEKQEIEHKSGPLLAGGLVLIIAGGALYAVGALTGPKPESIDAVLLDLASRKPPAETGPEARIRVKIWPRKWKRGLLERLASVISKSREVNIETSKRWISGTYTLEIKGPKEPALAAAKDAVEFCERTQTCKAEIEEL